MTIGSPGYRPQDERVSRRWFLRRMAWVSATAGAGGVLAGVPRRVRGRADLPGPPPRVPDAWLAEAPRQVEDPTTLTMSESMTLIRSGELDPADLVRAYVDRIEALDGVYQAYADQPGRDVLIAELDALPADERRSPLRGMCLVAKDNFYTSDLLTEGGSLVFEGFRPDYEATAVTRMRAAGGLIAGKGQMGNLAGGRARRYGTLIPTTRNAWSPDDERYSPGGSSSGSATAVAARLAVAGLGTQTGGSVTGPGNAQGLTCVKPTFGRVSLYGVIPLSYTRDHVGVMARDARDAAILLQVVAGPDPNDPRTLGLPDPPDYLQAATPFPGGRPRVRWSTRVGIWPGYFADENERVNELRRAFVGQLESNGGVEIVGELSLPNQWEELTAEPLGGSHGDPTAFFIEHLRRDVRNFADRLPRFLNGMLQSADTYVRVQQARNLLLDRIVSQLFAQCDVALTTATGAFDGTGLPLMCMPIGLDDDPETGNRVPRGVVMAARPFGEERLLAVAAAYQAVTGFHRMRPDDPA
ncbi:MAG: amidase [Gammaproteobacteria bacterium]|nr:amidase [Gammaproteobacteria bacterium]MDE0247097.1 amidase [Gammaproteobacteria bacterium]